MMVRLRRVALAPLMIAASFLRCHSSNSDLLTPLRETESVFASALPRIFFSDLDTGPNTGGQDGRGAFVTIYGAGFGSSRGASTTTVGGGNVDRYLVWSDTKVSFQLGPAAATGDLVAHAPNGSSNAVPFVVRGGRVLFVTPDGTGDGSYPNPMSPYAAVNSAQAGDTFYFRAGTYSGKYGNPNWSTGNFTLGPGQSGTIGHPVALVGYPGETAVLEGPSPRQSTGYVNIRMSNAYEAAHDVTIANLILQGTDQCLDGEGAGAVNVRFVGNTCSASYQGDRQTGVVTVSNVNWRLLGNELRDTGTTPPIATNRGIGLYPGANHVEIAWNFIHDMRMGNAIDVQGVDTQGATFSLKDIRIHDNVLTAASVGDMRGIGVSRVLDASDGTIYNNVLHNLGQDYAAIAIGGGSWDVYNTPSTASAPRLAWCS